MSFDMSTVGFTTKDYALTYDWRLLATYALGIGAKRDELDYLYENAKSGMKVFPTFAVIAAHEAIVELLGRTGGNMAMVVHGGQTIRAHRPAPSSGVMHTTGTIKGIYDLKKFAQVILETNTTCDGKPLFETTWSILFRGAGGFEGPRPPQGPEEPSVPKDRPADWTCEQTTSPEQALLYRIAGDTNPLHADPEFAAMVGFEQGPILHGLATFGFAARAITKHACGGDATKIKSFTAQFRRPVWPGDTIVTQGWQLDGAAEGDTAKPGRVVVTAAVKGRPEAVLSGAWAEIG